MAKDNELVIKINGNIKGYQDALKAASKETENLQNRLNNIAKIGAVAFAGLGASILLAAQSAAKFETIEAQFETLTGSVEEARKTIKVLSDFTAKTPFKFEQVAQAGKQLLAFKIQGDELKPTLRAIGDVAAATGAAFGDLNLIFGQVKAAGKLTGERLLQLEERAVPIGPALAKTMGVAESAIRDLVSKGEVDFATFQKAFKSLSEEGGLAFQGMEKRSKTLEGQLSTLADNFDLLTAEVGEQFLPVLKQLTGAMTNFLGFLRENPAMADFISRALVAGTVVGGLATTVALAGTVFLKLRASMIAATLATKGLGFAVKGLVGATGLGLIVAFLPEILDLFQFVFRKISFIFEGFVTFISQNAKGLGNILKGIFTFDAKTIEKGILQLASALDEGVDAAIKEFERAEKASKKQAEETKKDQESAAKSVEDSQKKQTDAIKKGVDARTQKLKDENRLLQAELSGQSKEQLAILKKRIAIEQKERDAQAIQNADRRKLALENIKLLNQQLDKAEKDAAAKRAKLEAEKDKKAEERRQKEREEVEERAQNLKNQNEILKAGLAEREKEEVDFLRRRQEIRNQTRDAEKIKNEEERNLSLENIKLKNEQLLAEESEFFAARDEMRAEQREIEAALQTELEELSTEKRRALQQQEIDELRASLETQASIRSKSIKKELLERRKSNKLFEDEEERFGTVIATFRKIRRSEEFQNAQTAAAALAQLQQSENQNLKAIGKAAALVQIGINTQKGAIAAYAALAGIPLIGPALGAAAAAALIAFGAERSRRVLAAQTGGFVPGSGAPDSQAAFLTPGEFIVPPQTANEVINAVAEQRAIERETAETEEETPEGFANEILVGFDGDEAADVLTVRQNEQNFLGTSQRVAFVR